MSLPQASKPGTQEKPRRAAASRMDNRLLEAANRIYVLWNGADASDIERRHQVALACLAVSAEASYGKQAVAKLAQHIGRSQSSVYEHIGVARVWPDATALKELVTSPEGRKPLTWTHLVELAKLDDDKRREELLSAAKENGWTVAELLAARDTPPVVDVEVSEDACSEQDEATSDGSIPATTSAPSRCLFVTLDELAATVGGVVSREGELQKLLAQADPSELDDSLERLQAARREAQRLTQILETCVVQLEERRNLEARKAELPTSAPTESESEESAVAIEEASEASSQAHSAEDMSPQPEAA